MTKHLTQAALRSIDKACKIVANAADQVDDPAENGRAKGGGRKYEEASAKPGHIRHHMGEPRREGQCHVAHERSSSTETSKQGRGGANRFAAIGRHEWPSQWWLKGQSATARY